MKKAGKPYKIIVDTNIWISFLIGKSLKGLQQYIDSQIVLIVTCNEQIHELTDVFKKTKINKYFNANLLVLINQRCKYLVRRNKDVPRFRRWKGALSSNKLVPNVT